MSLTLAFEFRQMPLRNPFTISRYTVKVQQTVIVSISDGEITGYGEATANPYYNSSAAKLTASLIKVKPVVALHALVEPEEMWQLLSKILSDDFFALCAVDVAYWDYFARKNGRTLRSYWSTPAMHTPITSFTIGIDTIATMKRKILETPWPLYKIKLGTANDIQIVQDLRKITDSIFRVDANCGWTAVQAVEYSKILKNFNVEFIEQPLPANDIEGMRKVRSESVLPIIADESCQREQDVLGCADLFNGINIKLVKCGGITPALRMIEEAKKLGLQLMVGCMTESTIGISGLTQLAPLLNHIDADGAMLLRDDIADGVSFNYGKIQYATGNGTGAELRVDKST